MHQVLTYVFAFSNVKCLLLILLRITYHNMMGVNHQSTENVIWYRYHCIGLNSTYSRGLRHKYLFVSYTKMPNEVLLHLYYFSIIVRN